MMAGRSRASGKGVGVAERFNGHRQAVAVIAVLTTSAEHVEIHDVPQIRDLPLSEEAELIGRGPFMADGGVLWPCGELRGVAAEEDVYEGTVPRRHHHDVETERYVSCGSVEAHHELCRIQIEVDGRAALGDVGTGGWVRM